MSNSRIYMPCIMGQGAWLTSFGVVNIANDAKALGIESEVFEYGDYGNISTRVDQHRNSDYMIAGLGYSLGVSTLTYLQSSKRFDLVLCLAGSTLGLNYAINKTNAKRAVLWRDPSTALSGWGTNVGFDKIIDVNNLHLLIDFDPNVTHGIHEELVNLINEAKK